MAEQQAVKISEGSWRIEENGVRSFLFEGADKALLVDTGFMPKRELCETLTSKPIMLVNTHADPDHIGGNSDFEAAYMSLSEYAHYSAAETAKPMPLRDGDIIDLGGRCFEVISIPGHTCGSIALLNRRERFIITGDTVSDAAIFMFGAERNTKALEESLRRLKSLAEFYDTVYPSHGTFPLDASWVDTILDGIIRVQSGDYIKNAPPFEIPAKLIIAGNAKFLMNL